tara:strand:- start:4091 stop:5233 length:1143 start_codon:yes stop_codon:yes gene_type:complete
MEIKVRAIEGSDNKSKAEIEETLLKKHEEELNQPTQENETEVVEVKSESTENQTESVTEVEEKTPSSELNDEDVLSYLKNRYDKEINSVDDLFAEKEANDPLPEDVSAYLKYKQETGRGIDDFYQLQRDYDSMEDEAVLADFIAHNEEGLDAIDIQDIMEDKFGFDEELDDPKDVKKKKLAKKRELAKAKKFFNEQKDKYKIPLESSGGGLSEDQEKQLDAYHKYIEQSKTVEEASKKRIEYFQERTKEVFSDDFKGFDFNVGDKDITFKPGTKEELYNVQVDFSNFSKKFIDDKGLIKNPKAYHKALSVALNPDKFAKHFYDLGVAQAVESVSKKSKNINMDVRQAPRLVSKDGLKIRNVQSQDRNSGRGLKIRSIKKV